MSALIAIEGIDGSGKSTLAAGLVDRLHRTGMQALLVKPLEPEPCLLSAVRATHGRVPQDAELSAARERFLAAYFGYRLMRSAECDIRPALVAGSTIVCDRYLASHRVNQRCFGQDLNVFEPLFRTLPTPLTVFLRVPVEIAADRLQRRQTVGVGDHLGFARAAATHFEELAASERWIVLDATQPVSDLVTAAAAALEAAESTAASPAT